MLRNPDPQAKPICNYIRNIPVFLPERPLYCPRNSFSSPKSSSSPLPLYLTGTVLPSGSLKPAHSIPETPSQTPSSGSRSPQTRKPPLFRQHSMLFSRPSSSGTASVLQPPSGSANRPESLQELPSLFRSKAKHSYSFDELRHQLRLISRAPSGIICGAALTVGVCFPLPSRPPAQHRKEGARHSRNRDHERDNGQSPRRMTHFLSLSSNMSPHSGQNFGGFFGSAGSQPHLSQR